MLNLDLKNLSLKQYEKLLQNFTKIKIKTQKKCSIEKNQN